MERDNKDFLQPGIANIGRGASLCLANGFQPAIPVASRNQRSKLHSNFGKQLLPTSQRQDVLVTGSTLDRGLAKNCSYDLGIVNFCTCGCPQADSARRQGRSHQASHPTRVEGAQPTTEPTNQQTNDQRSPAMGEDETPPHSRRWYMHTWQGTSCAKKNQQARTSPTTDHEEEMPWTVVQMVFWTNVNQACRLWTSTMFWPWRTQPKREDNISPGLGGISWSGGRLGHSHTIWSQVPRHEQPSQTQSVVGQFSQRPPSAAGEKEAPEHTDLASGQDPAKSRVFFQSMRWKYWLEKQSISWSLRLEATCWQRHQARQAFRTMCCRKPTSSFTPKFKLLPVRSWYHTQGRTKRQPWQVNRWWCRQCHEPHRGRRGRRAAAAAAADLLIVVL